MPVNVGSGYRMCSIVKADILKKDFKRQSWIE